MGPGRLTLGEGSCGIHWTGGWAFASEWLTKPPVGCISGIQQLRGEFDHSPFGTEAKSEWSYVHLHGAHTGTFFLLLLLLLLLIFIIVIIFLYRSTW